MKPLLSVIIPCFNEVDTVGQQLTAVSEQVADFEWEVLVVDNGSSDGTADVARSFTDKIERLRVLSAPDRRGAAHGRNAGARAAKGSWLVFCDADDVVGDGWLAQMGNALRQHPVVVPRFEGGRLNPEARGRPLGQQDGVDTLWYPPYFEHAGGSGIGIWSEVHKEVGGFDESLACCEDTDYTVRIQLLGHRIFFAENAVIHVRYPDNRLDLFSQARAWARANTTIYRRYGGGALRRRDAWRAYGRGLGRLLGKVGRIRKRTVQDHFAWELGWHLGLLEGAALNRVPPTPHRVFKGRDNHAR